MIKRADPNAMAQAEAMTAFPARPRFRARLFLTVLAIGLVTFGLTLWIVDRRMLESRLREAAACRGVTYEEARQTAGEVAETAHVSLSDAARMIKHLACPEGR